MSNIHIYNPETNLTASQWATGVFRSPISLLFIYVFFLISLASAYIFIRVVKLGGEREEEEEERTVVVIVVEFGPDWNAFLVKMHSFGELRAASRLIGGVIYQRTSRGYI